MDASGDCPLSTQGVCSPRTTFDDHRDRHGLFVEYVQGSKDTFLPDVIATTTDENITHEHPSTPSLRCQVCPVRFGAWI